MEQQGVQYTFSAKVWYSEWYFVSLPKTLASEIREAVGRLEEGWGRLKVTAKTGNSSWKTAIWFDTKHQTYLLPIKAEIRKKEKITADDEVEITLWV
ncbi:DUF1905 domain-containing protein [Christensenellaceae bacterium OttesenSCG-928-K19]|nr:DUF1905 domain-containing protein [Christensenellaceae bacterium OttesenSCG-928-K19]